MVNFKTISKIHKNIMYHDKCDIYEYVSKKDDDGAQSTQKNKVPLYLDVPCKISFSLRTWDTFDHKKIDITPYEKQPKIFLENHYKIEPGYYLEAKRYDKETGNLLVEYKGQCGLPQVSLTHQEVLIDVRGNC